MGIETPRGRSSLGGFSGMLGGQSRDIGPHLGIVPVPLEKFRDPGPRITEQCLVNEVDRCGRALDVQEDGADSRQRDAVFRIGM